MACVQYVQRVFPEAPVRVVNRTPKGDEEVAGHAVTALLDEPNPAMSGAAVMQALLADYNIHGNAYLLKFRTAGARVAELWYEPQLTIRPTWDPAGRDFLTGYQIWRVGRWYPLPVADVVHLRWGIDPRNPRMGLSPLRAALRNVFTDEEAEAYLAVLLHNMASPGAIISPAGDTTISPDEAQRLMAYFNSRFTGDGRGTTMVATGALKVDMPSWSPKDLDLTKIHHLSESRISGLLGVPAIVAGLSLGIEHSTYSNYGQAREAAYEQNILPTMRVFADTFTRALLRDDFGGGREQFVQFDIDDVRALQQDENAIADRAAKLFASGIIDRARALTLIGETPAPGDGGIYYLPRGGSFSTGVVAEPATPLSTQVNTEPGAPPAPVATNGHTTAPVPAA
jgi:HK97 family phage portal protein